MVLKTHYWNEPTAKAAFKRFVRGIFGLDFEAWDAAGHWDDAYTPFSFFDGDEIVSSVCLYLLDAVIDGRSTKLAQISAVGTREEDRGKGLNRELTERALEWAEGKHDGVFLFADEEAAPFYERTGFKTIEEFLEVAPAEAVTPREGAVMLDAGKQKDLARSHEFALRREPISRRLSIGNPKLTAWHAIYMLGDVYHEIPELDCLVAYERKGERLRVFDIIAEKMPQWRQLYPFIADAADREIEFHFHTDRLDIGGAKTESIEGNCPFVLPGFPVKTPVFPFTSRA